jgi:hypothetical protein
MTSQYYGSRTRTDGTNEKAYVAGRALYSLAGPQLLPIFEHPFISSIIGQEVPEDLESQLLVYEDEPFRRAIRVDLQEGLILSSVLTEATKAIIPPIVFVIVTKISHSILAILHEGNLYVAGFGDGGNSYPDKLSKIVENTRISSFQSLFTVTNGKLFSVDPTFPDENQEAFIAWIGFLDEDMVGRLNTTLSKAKTVFVDGVSMNGKTILTHNCSITFGEDMKYCEGASLLTQRGTTNCINWIQGIIGDSIDCGVIPIPLDCRHVTDEEWQAFYTAYTTTDNDSLITVIQRIQRRLSPNHLTRAITSTGSFINYGMESVNKLVTPLFTKRDTTKGVTTIKKKPKNKGKRKTFSKGKKPKGKK